MENQENASARLIAEARLLLGRGCLREQEARLAGGARRDHHPALRLFGHERILDQDKAELTDKEAQSFVIITNDQRHESQRLFHTKTRMSLRRLRKYVVLVSVYPSDYPPAWECAKKILAALQGEVETD